MASKEIVLEVNADKTQYMVMSRNQNGEWSHSKKNDNSSFESVEEFKCLGTTLTNQNSIQEKIKRRPKSGLCLLSFGAEYFVSQFAIQKILKGMHKYNFAYCFVWVWNLVAHIEGGT